MFEKVNPMHPDKIADRIAGAIVDYAYTFKENPKVAVEVLIGHGKCFIINETDTEVPYGKVVDIVKRISREDSIDVDYTEIPQDPILARNQTTLHCGDNGIFKGVPVSNEQQKLVDIAKSIYEAKPYDGKYIINKNHLIICQSNCEYEEIQGLINPKYWDKLTFNPLGYWTGGISVDSGATNRKLGSDMGDGVTGGGLCGKDLSKADVSVNIYAHLLAQETKQVIKCYCAIGDSQVFVHVGHNKSYLVSYNAIVEIARKYIKHIGGFEKFAEWGLIR